MAVNYCDKTFLILAPEVFANEWHSGQKLDLSSLDKGRETLL